MANPNQKQPAPKAPEANVTVEASASTQTIVTDAAFDPVTINESSGSTVTPIDGTVVTELPANTITPTEQVKVTESVSTPVVDKKLATSFEEMVSGIKSNGSLTERALVHSLEDYITAMKPGVPVSVTEGNRNQMALWRAVLNVVERSDTEFKSVFSILLAFFDEFKDTVFHERYVFRFADSIPLSTDQVATFHQIINLLKITCSPISRKQALKQVDLERTLRNNITEQGRQKIIGFYNM